MTGDIIIEGYVRLFDRGKIRLYAVVEETTTDIDICETALVEYLDKKERLTRGDGSEVHLTLDAYLKYSDHSDVIKDLHAYLEEEY